MSAWICAVKRVRSRFGRSLQLCATRSRRCDERVEDALLPCRAALGNRAAGRERKEFAGKQVKFRA